MARPNTAAVSGNKKSKLNPTVATLFNDERWGEANYISAPIDAKSFDALSQLGMGDRILFKATDRSSKNGNKLAFLEVIKQRPRGNTEEI